MTTLTARLLGVVTVVAAAAVLAGHGPTAVAGGVLLAFALPGLALTAVLFRGRDLAAMERVLLAPALSLGLLIVAGLLMHAAGVDLDRTAWTSATAGVTLVALLAAAVPGRIRAAASTTDDTAGAATGAAESAGTAGAALGAAVGATSSLLASAGRRTPGETTVRLVAAPTTGETTVRLVLPSDASTTRLVLPSDASTTTRPELPSDASTTRLELPSGATTTRLELPSGATTTRLELVPSVGSGSPAPHDPTSAAAPARSPRRLAGQLVPLAIAAMVLGGASWMAYDSARGDTRATVTALSAAPPAPADAAGRQSVTVTASGLVEDDGPYTVTVTGADGRRTVERVVPAGTGTWTTTVGVPGRQRVTIDLYRSGDTAPYRTVLIAASQ